MIVLWQGISNCPLVVEYWICEGLKLTIRQKGGTMDLKGRLAENFSTLILLMLLATLFSCAASTKQIVDKPNLSEKPTDSVRIVIKRVGEGLSCDLPVTIKENGKEVGDVGCKGELVWDRNPGESIITADCLIGLFGSTKFGRTFKHETPNLSNGQVYNLRVWKPLGPIGPKISVEPNKYQVTGLSKSDCSSLKNKKIYFTINVSQAAKDYIETYDFKKKIVNKTHFDKPISDFVSTELTNHLTSNCNAIVVKNIDESDIDVKIDVEKYYSQVVKADKFGDDSFAGIKPDYNINFSAEIASVLIVNNTIGDQKWKYNHLVNLKQEESTDFHKTLIGRDSSAKSIKYILKYDADYLIATGAYSFTTKGFFLTNQLAHFDIYDINSMDNKLTIEYDLKGQGVGFAELDAYMKYYGSIFGNMELLLLDYIRTLSEKLSAVSYNIK